MEQSYFPKPMYLHYQSRQQQIIRKGMQIHHECKHGKSNCFRYWYDCEDKGFNKINSLGVFHLSKGQWNKLEKVYLGN